VEASILTGQLPARKPRWRLLHLSDEQLVAAVRRGEEAAFAALVDRYRRPLLAFCRHILSSREDAEDVLQSTFAAAFHDLRESDREKINVRAWLYTVARNRCLNSLRARRETPTEALDAISTAGLSEEVERRAELRTSSPT
jgi:RNA polymerase sigma factor (sigma-70 family)